MPHSTYNQARACLWAEAKGSGGRHRPRAWVRGLQFQGDVQIVIKGVAILNLIGNSLLSQDIVPLCPYPIIKLLEIDY